MSDLPHPPEPISVSVQPVNLLPSDVARPPEEGMALCLSGGGYRAMLFHAGAIWRLNELGLLPKLKRISSVSGGSITAGVLALNWDKLGIFNDVAGEYETQIVTPIRSLASTTIDRQSILKGTFWFDTISDCIAAAYQQYLFGDATLQQIVDEPRFVFNATNLQSGVLWRFSKPYMADYRVGMILEPKIKLATAVAASSAFPPLLSPVKLSPRPSEFEPNSGTDLQTKEYRDEVILTDGGVYDNLGLETAWKRYTTIFVSDAGQGFSPSARLWTNWLCQAIRVLFTIDNQVRSLRRRQVVESYKQKLKTGAFWPIDADAEDFAIGSPFNLPYAHTLKLANVSTRLAAIDEKTQERLINWGYAIADLSYRQHFDKTAPPPNGLPYPSSGV